MKMWTIRPPDVFIDGMALRVKTGIGTWTVWPMTDAAKRFYIEWPDATEDDATYATAKLATDAAIAAYESRMADGLVVVDFPDENSVLLPDGRFARVSTVGMDVLRNIAAGIGVWPRFKWIDEPSTPATQGERHGE